MSPLDTPSLWAPLPAQHHRSGKMEELLELHGASGPHSFTVLLGEAAAVLQGRDAKGVLEMSWREFARFSGFPLGEARERLRELEAEPFTLVQIESQSRFGFRARIVRWEEWDVAPKDPTAAERKRRERALKRDTA